MDEIKVVPYIPDEDYDNPAMVVDFYEFTMANCLFLHGFKNTTLVFDMFFRKNPDAQGYSISAGQRKLTRFLLNYHFNAQDIWWLRTKGMSEEFCEYLRTYQWKGDMYALPEGTVAYPHVQMVRIECDLVGAILDRDLPAADHELPQSDRHQGYPRHRPEHPHAPQRDEFGTAVRRAKALATMVHICCSGRLRGHCQLFWPR